MLRSRIVAVTNTYVMGIYINDIDSDWWATSGNPVMSITVFRSAQSFVNDLRKRYHDALIRFENCGRPVGPPMPPEMEQYKKLHGLTFRWPDSIDNWNFYHRKLRFLRRNVNKTIIRQSKVAAHVLPARSDSAHLECRSAPWRVALFQPCIRTVPNTHVRQPYRWLRATPTNVLKLRKMHFE